MHFFGYASLALGVAYIYIYIYVNVKVSVCVCVCVCCWWEGVAGVWVLGFRLFLMFI